MAEPIANARIELLDLVGRQRLEKAVGLRLFCHCVLSEAGRM